MSSVILSTWVITLSTLSRYLPKERSICFKKVFIVVVHLHAMITIVQTFGTFMPNVSGTRFTLFPLSSSSSLIHTCFLKVINIIQRSYVDVNLYYLWPGERRLIAKVKDEAAVQFVLAAYPRN